MAQKTAQPCEERDRLTQAIRTVTDEIVTLETSESERVPPKEHARERRNTLMHEYDRHIAAHGCERQGACSDYAVL